MLLNISAYLFTPLDDREALRERLLETARSAELLGTVLVAPEGINMFLAGEAEALRDWLDELRTDPRFADLEAKESWSQDRPFRKLLVKLKNEIIRMDHPTIRPSSGRAPGVDSHTLRRWLDQGHDDQGREVVMLDTRNAFEVDYGTFTDAIDWRIEKFSQFPDAVRAHRDDLAGRTVVSFCTGGIRCEKAALVMDEIGVDRVLQLDGGILRWFEEQGEAHWEGECFVFDEREALRPTLAESREPTRREVKKHLRTD